MRMATKIVLCFCFFTLGSGDLLSQQIEECSKTLNSRESHLDISEPKHPYDSLFIFVGKRKTRHVQGEIFDRPGMMVHYLQADGMLSSVETVEVDPSHSEFVARSIDFYGKNRGNVILNLWVDDDAVNVESVLKALRSLKGVEKKFKRFRLDIVFVNTEPGKENGIQPKILEKKDAGPNSTGD